MMASKHSIYYDKKCNYNFLEILRYSNRAVSDSNRAVSDSNRVVSDSNRAVNDSNRTFM